MARYRSETTGQFISETRYKQIQGLKRYWRDVKFYSKELETPISETRLFFKALKKDERKEMIKDLKIKDKILFELEKLDEIEYRR